MASRHRSPARFAPREHFGLFVTRADGLSRMPIISSQGLSNEWSISMGVGQPTVFTAVQPDEDQFRSYLMAFCKFISKGEPLFVGSVHNLCHKHFTSDEFKGHIRNCQRGWKDHCVRSGMKLNINGHDVRPEHIADLWINGRYFHDDPEKAEELKRYMPVPIIRQEFLNFVIEATRVILGTGYTIKMALRDGAVND
jgi:hypothetical protein